MATLHIYNANTWFDWADVTNSKKTFIYINNKVAARLETGQAKIVKVPAGGHRLSIQSPISFMLGMELMGFDYRFEPGRDYYLRYAKVAGKGIGGMFASPITSFSMTDKAALKQESRKNIGKVAGLIGRS